MATTENAVEPKTGETKRKRSRSPSYPFVDLEAALKRAKEFYEREQRNPASIGIAVKHWNYNEKSSGGQQTAAALISFGLMRDEGTGSSRKLQLTENAIRILLDQRPDSSERESLIKQAALKPKIHSELWKKWGMSLPSDEQFRYTLTVDWEPQFNEKAADNLIREYKDTIDFAKLTESDNVSEEVEDSGEPHGNTQTELKDRNSQIVKAPLKTHMQEFIVPLSQGNKAIFQWPSDLTKDDVEDLKDSLEILKRKIARSTQKREPSSEELE